MPLPLLDYPSSSQNHRVTGFEVLGAVQPRNYTAENRLSTLEADELIQAAYRQIFHEQQMLASTRQRFLESQFKDNQINVREFIRGLLLSDSFRRLNYDPNSNYRFVQLCVSRVLGREVYNDREKMAWSIVLATKGLRGFVDALLNSGEYANNFGDDIVPYQRRRILPQRDAGELPFERMPRYGADYRDRLPKQSTYDQFELFTWEKFVRETRWKTVGGLLVGLVAFVFFLSVVVTVASLS